MANSISVNLLNKNTIIRRLQQYAVLSLAGLTVYVGGLGLSKYQTNNNYNRKFDVVEKLINSKDYTLASQTLATFEKNKLLRVEDAANLKLTIQRKSGESKLDDLISDGNYQEATITFKEYEKSGIYNKDILNKFRNKIYDISEPVLFSQVQASNKQQKTKLCNKYLQIHPKGANRVKIIEELTFNEINNFLAKLDNKEDFDNVYSKLMNLNNLLAQYKSEGAVLSKEVIKKTSQLAVNNYLKNDTSAHQPIAIGKTVKVKSSSQDHWNNDYLAQRIATMPIGSIGKIISITGPNDCMVRFEDITHYEWKIDWDDEKPYWKDGKKNSAQFMNTELAVYWSINDLEKDKLTREFEIFQKLIDKY